LYLYIIYFQILIIISYIHKLILNHQQILKFINFRSNKKHYSIQVVKILINQTIFFLWCHLKNTLIVLLLPLKNDLFIKLNDYRCYHHYNYYYYKVKLKNIHLLIKMRYHILQQINDHKNNPVLINYNKNIPYYFLNDMLFTIHNPYLYLLSYFQI